MLSERRSAIRLHCVKALILQFLSVIGEVIADSCISVEFVTLSLQGQLDSAGVQLLSKH